VGWSSGAADYITKPFSPLACRRCCRTSSRDDPEEEERRQMILEKLQLLQNS
jgi:DNA-binding response OmpR family regulator